MSQGVLDFEPRRAQSPAVGKFHRNAGKAEKQAAKDIVPKSGTQRFAILELIAGSGHHGTSQWAVVVQTDFLRSSVCARFNELEEGGWIERTGKTRKSPMNTMESLYRATQRGRAAATGSGRHPSPDSPSRLGDAVPARLACPNCGSTERQRHQWTPDLEPKKERHQCFDCGYDSGWVKK